MLVKMGQNRNPYTLLVGMLQVDHIITKTTVESSIEIHQKTRARTAI
jgi:hypothetical protein